MYDNKYNYDELLAKATSETATASDRVALVKWFENYDMADWNGEYFDLGNGMRLYRVFDITYDDDGNEEKIELVDGEIK